MLKVLGLSWARIACYPIVESLIRKVSRCSVLLGAPTRTKFFIQNLFDFFAQNVPIIFAHCISILAGVEVNNMYQTGTNRVLSTLILINTLTKELYCDQGASSTHSLQAISKYCI